MRFREYVRQKLYERCKSYTRAFVMLDNDRDGLVTSLDVANYLMSRGVEISQGTQAEIESWFSDYTDTPWRGVDMTGFVRFLQGAGSNSEHLSGFKADGPFKECRLLPDDIQQVRKTLATYMCSLGCSFSQFYKLLCGGRGYLYEHQLREALELQSNRQFSEKEWDAIIHIIKTDKLIDYISQDELRDFIEAKQPEDIIEVEEDTPDVPWTQKTLNKPKCIPQDTDHPNPSIQTTTQHCDEDSSSCHQDHTDGTTTHTHKCSLKSQTKTCKDWEPKDDSDILVSTSSNTPRRLPTVFRLTSAPATKRTGGRLAQRLDGSDLGVFTLLSEKIQQTGRPADVFRRFDRLRSRCCSWRQFSQQVRIMYGMDLTPERLRDAVCNVLGVAGEKGVTYDMFQQFYSPEAASAAYLVKIGANNSQSSSAARGERRTFVFNGPGDIVKTKKEDFSAQIKIQRQGQAELNQSSPKQKALSQEDSPKLRKQESPKCDCECQKYPQIPGSRLNLASSAPNISAVPTRPSTGPTRAQVEAAYPRSETKIVTNAEATATREVEDAKAAFILHVGRQMTARGGGFVQLLRETFPGQREITAKDVLWFFRNKVGVSYSPQLILSACNVQDGYVDVAGLGKIFKDVSIDQKSNAGKFKQEKAKAAVFM